MRVENYSPMGVISHPNQPILGHCPTPNHTYPYTQSHLRIHPVTPTPYTQSRLSMHPVTSTNIHSHTPTHTHSHIYPYPVTPTHTISHIYPYPQSHPRPQSHLPIYPVNPPIPTITPLSPLRTEDARRSRGADADTQ